MKTVLITGGSRGIGKAVAKKYAEEGYDVVAPPSDELDLKNGSSINAFIEKNNDRCFDAIINNAGINDISLLENVTDDEIERAFAINLVAPIKLIRGFAGAMKRQKYGRIVNIGSIWAVVSKPGRLVYSASKNGLHGVTNTLAVELAPFNILVNTVCPGFTNTELTSKNNTKEQIERICLDIPAGRMAEPDEIASAVYFLGSHLNTYITGQKIAVDGGFCSK
ncbi:MAG: SDR family oxidoreductase [Methanosarcinales archaeon]|nr:MAG: SDR family oxidoreductase [Methanosarcinales archaeon]